MPKSLNVLDFRDCILSLSFSCCSTRLPLYPFKLMEFSLSDLYVFLVAVCFSSGVSSASAPRTNLRWSPSHFTSGLLLFSATCTVPVCMQMSLMSMKLSSGGAVSRSSSSSSVISFLVSAGRAWLVMTSESTITALSMLSLVGKEEEYYTVICSTLWSFPSLISLLQSLWQVLVAFLLLSSLLSLLLSPWLVTHPLSVLKCSFFLLRPLSMS